MKTREAYQPVSALQAEKILLWVQSDLGRPVPLAKIFRFSFDPNHFYISRHPRPHRGAFRDRHERRAGDAMDAKARSAKILRGRTALTRTAKSCGPDAPTMASSWWRQLHWRGWQKSPVTRESAKETVKTLARGMPGDSGVTVVTNSRVFSPREAAGASGARHSLRPLISEGRRFRAQLGRIVPREGGFMSDVIARSEATKQSIP